MSPLLTEASPSEILMTPTLKVLQLQLLVPFKQQKILLLLRTILVSLVHGIKARVSYHSQAQPPRPTTKVHYKPSLIPIQTMPIQSSACAQLPGASMMARRTPVQSPHRLMLAVLMTHRKQTMKKLHSMPDPPFQPQQDRQAFWPMTQTQKAVLSIFTHSV